MVVKLERVSNGLGGADPNGSSGAMDLSADGRFVAFVSEASNLVQGDRNGTGDVFLLDRTTGVTERVSVAWDGSEANGYSGGLYEDPPAVSDDGRFVAFTSEASNLVPGDDNGRADVFRVDRATGEIRRISEGVDGRDAGGGSSHPTMSADGRFVAFLTEADDLGAGGDPGADVLIWDAATGGLRSASADVRALGLDRVDIAAGVPSISADGRFVAFGFGAKSIGAGPVSPALGAEVPSAPNVEVGCFLFDRVAGTTEFVAIEAVYARDGFDLPIPTRPSLSADGSRVAFVNGHVDTNKSGSISTFYDLSVIDTRTGKELARYAGSEVADVAHPIESPSLSGNGRRVAFTLDESWFAQNSKILAFAYDPQPYDRSDVYLSLGGTPESPPPSPPPSLERDGTDDADRLVGTKGDDELRGLAGADRLSGKRGNDRLDGGQGDDVLAGGGGNDVFTIGREQGQDLVQDLKRGDRLDLSDWFENADALPASWRDGIGAGDEGVTVQGKSLVIDLGRAVGGDAGEHVLTIKGQTGLALGSLILGTGEL